MFRKLSHLSVHVGDKSFSSQSSEATSSDHSISILPPCSSAEKNVSEPVVQLPTLEQSTDINSIGSSGSECLSSIQSADQSVQKSKTPSPERKISFKFPPPPQNPPSNFQKSTTTTTTRSIKLNDPVNDRAISPLTTATQLISVSPTSTEPSTLNISSGSTSTTSSIPLAIAFRETCNAKFSGTKECVSKVTGEVVISFPAAFLSQLTKSEPLTFKLEKLESIERLLHNQVLLKR